MSRNLSSLSLLCALGLAGCWAGKPGPIPVDKARAPVRIVGRPVQGPVTWITVAVRAGSAHDPVGQEGLSALSARMLREGGAGDRTPEAVDELLYRLGTDIDVVVGKELVTFRIAVLTEDLPVVTSLLSDMFQAPGLDDDTLVRLREEARDALDKGILQDDEATGLEVLDNLLYAGHPYGHSVQGRGGVVDTLTTADVQRFLETRYLRSTVVLGVAGVAVDADGGWRADVPSSTDLASLHTALSSLPDAIYDPPTPKRVPAVEGRSLLVVDKPTQVTGVHFGHPTELHRGHPDWPAMLLAFTALGEHRQGHGRLYGELRGDRGLNYGDYAYIERYEQAGWSSRQETGTGRVQNPFYVWLRPTSQADAPFALRGATRVVEHFVEEGLDADEFELMRTYLSGRVSLWADDPGRRLGWAAEAVAMGWPDPIATLPDAVEALTLEEVNAAVKRHIHPESMRYVVVTGGADELVEQVSDNVTTPLAYSGSTPPAEGTEQAAEDADWASTPIGWDDVRVIESTDLFR